MNLKQFDTSRMDANVQAIFKMLPPVFTEFIVTRENIGQFRAMVGQLLPEKPFESEFATRDKIELKAANHNIDLYHYQPIQKQEGLTPAIIWIHGGGYIQGSAKDDGYVLPLLQALKCQVFSVDYRLAPEHPFPAGHNDCLTAYQWVLENANTLGVDATKIAIAGTSAGGGMTAGLALKIRDKGLPQPACQLLRCPMIDNLNETSSSRVIGYPLWKRETNINAWEMYLNGTPGSDASPYAAAARATEVSNLPPTLIAVGQEDVFTDENITYAQRLMQADVPVELGVYPGVVHGAEAIARPTPIVQQMDAQVVSFLKRYL